MTVWATRADQVDLRGPNPHDLARSPSRARHGRAGRPGRPAGGLRQTLDTPPDRTVRSRYGTAPENGHLGLRGGWSAPTLGPGLPAHLRAGAPLSVRAHRALGSRVTLLLQVKNVGRALRSAHGHRTH